MIEFLRPQACVRNLLARFAKQSKMRLQPTHRRRNLQGERLESRELLTSVFAVTYANELLRFDSATPSDATSLGTVSGLQANVDIVGIDFRPATGQLYALGLVEDGVETDCHIYTINVETAAATEVGSFNSTIEGSKAWAIDFNPAADRIRVVNDLGQNLRVNPNTGALVGTDTSLAYVQGDVNSGHGTDVRGIAYSNNVGGAVTTTLYSLVFDGIDGVYRIARQGGVEGAPSPNLGALTTVGSLGVDNLFSFGFDIDSHTGRAFAALNPAGSTSLYTINLTTGAASAVTTIGDGSIAVRDIAVINQPAVSTAILYAVNSSGQLVRFAANAPGTVTIVGTIIGLQGGEVIQGIDFRPATGQLFALGVVNTTGTDEGRIYTINTSTAAATAVAGGATPFSTTLADAALYGFDFNPVPDRIRVVNNAENNLRANPATGGLAGTDTSLAYDASDTNVGQNPNIVGSAYTHSQANSTSTTLYAIDGTLNTLVRQGSLDSTPVTPNAGTLFTVGSLGQTLSSSDVGFDIRPGTGTAYAALEVGGNTGLYTINVTTGAATLVGLIGNGATDIVALSVLPEAHFEVFLPDGGSTATASVVSGNLVVRDGSQNDLIVPVALGTVNARSLRIFGGTGADAVTLDASLVGAFTGQISVSGNAGNDSLVASSINFGVTFDGGADNDTANGGSGNDTFQGGTGDDLLYGNSGNDVLNGQDGSDTILGVTGSDTITGGAGADFVNGGAQADQLDGGDGDDVLDGGTGIDTLVGGAGTNVLRSDVVTDIVLVSDVNLSVSRTAIAGAATDLLRGTPTLVLTVSGTSGGTINAANYLGNTVLLGSIGNDTLVGGGGADFIVGGAGSDLLNGGDGNDTIRGLAGSDQVNGQLGNDSLDAGIGDDFLDGGDGVDTVLGGDGNDYATGGLGNDSIQGGNGNDFLEGADGNDQIFGEAGNDTLRGGTGDDTLDGGDGNDGLSGFIGNDSLIGGIGRDTLLGSLGNDVLRGNAGNDILLGEDGDDSLNGDAGTDTVSGGDGADRIIDPVNEIDEAFTFSAGWVETLGG